MLVKAFLMPLLTFLSGLGALRASVALQDYLLLLGGMLLALVGVLWLAQPSAVRAFRAQWAARRR